VYSVRRVVLGEAVEPSDMWGPLQLGRGQKTKAMLKQGTFQTQTSLTYLEKYQNVYHGDRRLYHVEGYS
jgi:hypothetical protein